MTQATLTDIDRGLTCLLRTQHSQLRLAGGNHVEGVIGYQAGADAILPKPSDMDTLRQLVINLLHARQHIRDKNAGQDGI